MRVRVVTEKNKQGVTLYILLYRECATSNTETVLGIYETMNEVETAIDEIITPFLDIAPYYEQTHCLNGEACYQKGA